MITVEIRINQTLIGQAYVRNTGYETRKQCLYKVEYYKPETKLQRFEVMHEPEKGLEKLLQIIFRKLK